LSDTNTIFPEPPPIGVNVIVGVYVGVGVKVCVGFEVEVGRGLGVTRLITFSVFGIGELQAVSKIVIKVYKTKIFLII